MRVLVTAFLVVGAALSSLAQSVAELQSVDLERDGLTEIVALQFTSLTTASSGYLSNPPRFFIDVNAKLAAPASVSFPNAHLVRRVRSAQRSSDTTRVVLDLAQDARVDIVRQSETQRILLRVEPKTQQSARTKSQHMLIAARVVEGPSEIRIDLQLDSEASFTSGTLRDPDRFYLDLSDTRPVQGLTGAIASSPSLLRAVRIGRFSQDTTRIVAELPSGVVATAERDSSASIVSILIRKETPQDAGVSSKPQLTSESVVQPAETVPAEPLLLEALPGSPKPVTLTPVLEPLDASLLDSIAVEPASGLSTDDLVENAANTVHQMNSSPPVIGTSTVHIPRISRPITLQDLIARPADIGVRVTDFRQREPRDGIPATEATAAYLSYDDENLYVGFVCEDAEGHVRGRMSKREEIGDDDVVTVYLDTFHDGQRAYYFSVNPRGIQADGVISGTGGTDSRFDTLWYSDARLTDSGFVALIKIPFKSLRFTPSSQQTWGVAVARSIRGKNETSFWPYVTQRQRSLVRQMAAAEGLENISPSRNLQFIPYFAFTGARTSDGLTTGYRQDRDTRAGFDSKIVLKNAFTLDFTIKPDFSQVETNDPQVTVNRRFEVFFPEKRPFFLENANYFDTPLNLFFTRRIAAPDYGARLTGRAGRWNLGVLAMDDRAPGRIAQPGSTLSGKTANAVVARVLRDFGIDSNFGLMFTERRFGQTKNRVGSVDARIRLSPTWYFSGQAAYSQDRGLDSSSRLNDTSGSALLGTLSRSGRNFTFSSTYEDFSKNFRVPLGFLPRVDIRRTTTYGGYLWRPTSGPVYDFGPSLTVAADWDHTGRLQDKYSYASYRMDFAGPVGFELYRKDAYEFYLGEGFRYHATGGNFYANWFKKFTFYGSYDKGGGINYSPAAGVDPYVGGSQNGSFGFTWRPASRMRLENYYLYTQLLGPRSPNGTAPTAFVNHLERVKINYQFTKELSFRGIFDYSFVAPNAALFYAGRFKTFTPDLLLTYLLNYGTAVYIGYNQRLENLAIDPEQPGALRRIGGPSYLTGQQLFVKLAYLKRF